MRRLMREKSVSADAKRDAVLPRVGKGLNSRTSALGKAARPSSSGSMPWVYMSSSSSRTRTPRCAALRSSRRIKRPVSSSCRW